MAPVNEGVAYVSSSGALLKTVNGGQKWNVILNGGLGPYSLEVDPTTVARVRKLPRPVR